MWFFAKKSFVIRSLSVGNVEMHLYCWWDSLRLSSIFHTRILWSWWALISLSPSTSRDLTALSVEATVLLVEESRL